MKVPVPTGPTVAACTGTSGSPDFKHILGCQTWQVSWPVPSSHAVMTSELPTVIPLHSGNSYMVAHHLATATWVTRGTTKQTIEIQHWGAILNITLIRYITKIPLPVFEIKDTIPIPRVFMFPGTLTHVCCKMLMWTTLKLVRFALPVAKKISAAIPANMISHWHVFFCKCDGHKAKYRDVAMK